MRDALASALADVGALDGLAPLLDRAAALGDAVAGLAEQVGGVDGASAAIVEELGASVVDAGAAAAAAAGAAADAADDAADPPAPRGRWWSARRGGVVPLGRYSSTCGARAGQRSQWGGRSAAISGVHGAPNPPGPASVGRFQSCLRSFSIACKT